MRSNSPVVKSTTIRMVLSLAVTKRFYLRQPPDFVDPTKPNHLCLLHKSLYGLKEVPRAWFHWLTKALQALSGSQKLKCHLVKKEIILELLERVNFSKAKSISSSITTTANLHLDDSPLFDDLVKYRQLVGALHQGTSDYGLLIKHKSGYVLHAYIDSYDSSLSAFLDTDWAGFLDDRRSTRGYAIYLKNNLISWSVRKQRIVSQSSTESGYKALADSVAELTWIEALLQELKVPMTFVPVL
ncbi:uncharacterized mitochondrial protein-like protein [Tanacetum coccineum]